jgi:hypothetical protein
MMTNRTAKQNMPIPLTIQLNEGLMTIKPDAQLKLKVDARSQHMTIIITKRETIIKSEP